MEKKYFGTDGIRGRVGKSNINAEFMLKLGWAFGKVIDSDKSAKVLIGGDTRNSVKMIESALQAGLSAAGADVYLLGVLPTPAIAYLTRSLRATAGIVISASHNPYQDNGVKFFDKHGMKLTDELELSVEAKMDTPMRTVRSDKLGHISQLVDAAGRYIEFCKSIFPSDLTLKQMKIVIDCANGATFDVAPKIFHELGAEVIAMNNQPNGININEKCGATDVRQLQTKVAEHQADLGIALDGDGDRLIMVDHNSERVDGDELLCIIAIGINAASGKRKGVVGTVMSNLGLEQALTAKGIKFCRTKVGDRYVLEGLIKRGWTLGGESSGHIVDLDFTTTGDGIITALQVLRIMQMSGKSLHELKKVIVKRPQILINVPVYGEKDVFKFPKVSQTVKSIEQELGVNGRVLLRPSGTEPVVRVMVEGSDEGQVRGMAEKLAATVQAEMAEK